MFPSLSLPLRFDKIVVGFCCLSFVILDWLNSKRILWFKHIQLSEKVNIVLRILSLVGVFFAKFGLTIFLAAGERREKGYEQHHQPAIHIKISFLQGAVLVMSVSKCCCLCSWLPRSQPFKSVVQSDAHCNPLGLSLIVSLTPDGQCLNLLRHDLRLLSRASVNTYCIFSWLQHLIWCVQHMAKHRTPYVKSDVLSCGKHVILIRDPLTSLVSSILECAFIIFESDSTFL